jgi:hypothetical protein
MYKISQDLMALWWRYQGSKSRLFAVYLDGRSGWLAEAGGQDVNWLRRKPRGPTLDRPKKWSASEDHWRWGAYGGRSRGRAGWGK